MRAGLRLRTALFLAALMLLGCQSLKLAFYKGPLHDVNYREEFNRWTNKAKLYDRLDTVIFVQATLKSPGFTARYIDTYARSYHLNHEEKMRLAERLTADARQSYEFVLSAFTAVESENNLEDPSCSYKLYLITPDGRRLKPIEVRRVKKVGEAMISFFPHITSWRKVYIVRFAGPLQERATLVVTGPMGNIFLNYPSDGIWVFSKPPF